MDFTNINEFNNNENIVNNPEIEINEEIINSYIITVPAREQSEREVVRVLDQCVYQLSNKQDRVYTRCETPDENTERWTMALWDAHGSTRGPYDLVTGRFKKDNFMLDCLDEMTSNGNIDKILEKDIFSEEDPALALQYELGRKCIEQNKTMDKVGATMIVVKVNHIISEKKIEVEVLSCGDSTVIIFCNGEKVLENDIHNSSNEKEIARLIAEKRVHPQIPTLASSTFEILSENHICSKPAKYILTNSGSQCAPSQSVGHLQCMYKIIKDKKGLYGIDPFKARLEFSDTDEINIKLFSDGVSDMISTERIISDAELVKASNATDLANLAKARWEQQWQICSSKEMYLKSLDDPTICSITGNQCFNTVDRDGNSCTDDISCISWIQTRRA